MQSQLFAIIDVETTGGGIAGNRITEICIALLKDGEVVDKYTTLVNPERDIPQHITALTGIDNDMVADAPRFFEVAETIEEFTKDAVFVAHNVSFDYNVIRGEFRLLGQHYNRKKLCTVRLSRKLIPGHLSYSLGRLCNTINIPHFNRHRAEGDVDATVILFQRLLSLDEDFSTINSFLNPRSKQATLPPHIPAEQINELPEEAGIYLFKNQKHQVIYAGKAKNIKKRVLSHFYDKKTKEYQLGQETHFIDYELTGNELLALLVESEHIRKHYPKFNRAQKWPATTYQIISYVNQRGIIQLALGKTKAIQDSVSTFYNRAEAVEKLEEICETFNLCPRFCTLQSTSEKCSHYRIKNCEGVCEGSEKVADYNLKVQAAIRSLEENKPSFAIQGKGRTKGEIAFALVAEGQYKGFGFFDRSEAICNIEDYEPFLKLQPASYHTHAIIRSHLKKHGERNVVYFDLKSTRPPKPNRSSRPVRFELR
ncbi:exonuclease domain-containing protein [Aequorivita vladivostokensis]|uniref:exonuclease domain-containing protein n=1 Tax=Aequorivita vladivostokensis TaxID=171194 RepID=UPI0005D318D8|nr:exonuclease domain-containing protein [Aequorivita vladivostokensis]HAV53370.1 DNA polymerase III subunit epsilon [Aequorivita sp.]|tara:strand:+ start:2597 stop:4042 length:1446 start_codon:yes stop_codon:yes gene_type:complete